MENKYLEIAPLELPWHIGAEAWRDVYMDCCCHITNEPTNEENVWIRALVILEGIQHIDGSQPASLFLYYDGCILQRGDGVSTETRVRVLLHHVVMYWGDCPDVVLDLINDSRVYETNG